MLDSVSSIKLNKYFSWEWSFIIMVAITLLTHMPSIYLKPALKMLKFFGPAYAPK